jgi:hypothetical protein
MENTFFGKLKTELQIWEMQVHFLQKMGIALSGPIILKGFNPKV